MDSVGAGSGAYSDQAAPGSGLGLRLALSNPVVRAAVAAGTLLGTVGLLHLAGGGSGTEQVRRRAMGCVQAVAEGPVCGRCAAGRRQPSHSAARRLLAPLPLPQAGSAPQVFQVQQIAASLVGFLCYKAAVVGVAIIPAPAADELSLLAQADAPGGGGGGSNGGRPDGWRADGSRD